MRAVHFLRRIFRAFPIATSFQQWRGWRVLDKERDEPLWWRQQKEEYAVSIGIRRRRIANLDWRDKMYGSPPATGEKCELSFVLGRRHCICWGLLRTGDKGFPCKLMETFHQKHLLPCKEMEGEIRPFFFARFQPKAFHFLSNQITISCLH